MKGIKEMEVSNSEAGMKKYNDSDSEENDDEMQGQRENLTLHMISVTVMQSTGDAENDINTDD